MFNNIGNLSPEWVNQYINSCQFHRSRSSLKSGYLRADIIMMSVNILKFKYWNRWLRENYVTVYTKMYKLMQDVTQLSFIDKSDELVIEIATNSKMNDVYVQQKVLQHRL